MQTNISSHVPAVHTTCQNPPFPFQIFAKSKKIIVDMARKSSASCVALPLSVTCDPTASIFVFNLYLGFWLVTVLPGNHIHSRPSSRVTSLWPFLISSHSSLAPSGKGVGWVEMTRGWQRVDSLYIVESHYLHLSIFRHNDRHRTHSKVSRWVSEGWRVMTGKHL